MTKPPRLAIHTWTLDTTPLADLLRIARETGWAAVELRRVDFVRAGERGQTAAEVIDLVKASSLPVACVGVEFGWSSSAGCGQAGPSARASSRSSPSNAREPGSSARTP